MHLGPGFLDSIGRSFVLDLYVLGSELTFHWRLDFRSCGTAAWFTLRVNFMKFAIKVSMSNIYIYIYSEAHVKILFTVNLLNDYIIPPHYIAYWTYNGEQVLNTQSNFLQTYVYLVFVFNSTPYSSLKIKTFFKINKDIIFTYSRAQANNFNIECLRSFYQVSKLVRVEIFAEWYSIYKYMFIYHRFNVCQQIFYLTLCLSCVFYIEHLIRANNVSPTWEET